MNTLFHKVISPFKIAWGRTPVAWKWKTPGDDLDFVRMAIARRYHPRWHRDEHIRVSNALYFFMFLAWPARALGIIFRQTRKHSERAKQISGKGLATQISDQLRILIKYRNNPEVYYYYELFDAHRLAQSRYFIMDNEMFALVAQLNNYEPDDLVENKDDFNAYMQDRGINVIQDLAVIRAGEIQSLSMSEIELPAHDFIVKPCRGLQGNGFACYEYQGPDSYISMDGSAITSDALLQDLLRQSKQTDLLLQPRLTNHQAIKSLTLRGFATARILTGLSNTGETVVLAGVFKMPLGAEHADNYAKGSIASRIDLDTGALGSAIPEELMIPPIDVHPTTGAQITGTILPRWEEAKDLLKSAHAQLPQFVLLAWDVGFQDSGPVIVEANRDMGMLLLQGPGPLPLGITGLPQLCRERLEN